MWHISIFNNATLYEIIIIAQKNRQKNAFYTSENKHKIYFNKEMPFFSNKIKWLFFSENKVLCFYGFKGPEHKKTPIQTNRSFLEQIDFYLVIGHVYLS